MMFNRKVFFDKVRDSVFHGKLTQQQVDGMTRILDYYEQHYAGSMTQKQFAYLLATIYHETAHTMQPIKEFGGSHMWYAPAYGRGLVQITHDANYKKFGAIPYDKALEWPTALDIVFRGCADGMFTGKRLGDYINARKTDFTGARRCVNGTDRAALIAGYARSFDAALTAAAHAPAEIHAEGAVAHAPSKTIFDQIGDTIGGIFGGEEDQVVVSTPSRPSVRGQIGFIAAAVVAGIGALNQISGSQWETALSTPSHDGLNQILFGVAIAVANAIAPPWLSWLLPRVQK